MTANRWKVAGRRDSGPDFVFLNAVNAEIARMRAIAEHGFSEVTSVEADEYVETVRSAETGGES